VKDRVLEEEKCLWTYNGHQGYHIQLWSSSNSFIEKSYGGYSVSPVIVAGELPNVVILSICQQSLRNSSPKPFITQRLVDQIRERVLPGYHRQYRLQSSSLYGGLVIWIAIQITIFSQLGFLAIPDFNPDYNPACT
jgi:hypothetical protein